MKSIMLLEPDKKLAQTYAAFLRESGYEVEIVHHAQDGIFAADAKRPDLILLELQLAGHSGVEFLYELRSYAEWQPIPVVLLTVTPPHSLMITREILDSLGIIEVLYKPATHLKTLRSAVDQYCGQSVGE